MTNYGQPVDPKSAPGAQSVVLRSVALGFSTEAEVPQLPPGISSRGSNFLPYMGGLIPRPGLASFGSFSTSSGLLQAAAGFVGDCPTASDRRYPVALAAGLGGVYFSQGSWSTLSQTGPAGLSNNTISASTTFFDAVPYFHPTSDEFELCFVNDTGNQAFTWRPENASGSRCFSTLTNAPGAKYVAAFDSRLVFASILTSGGDGTDYPQRVQWSARGNPELYTAPDGGFEELLDAKGIITRLMATEDRLIVFFNREVWQGFKAPFPFTFQFLPLDRGVGTPAPWSVAQTSRGLMFLSDDYSLYLLPQGGSPVQVAPGAARFLRETIAKSSATLASATYIDAFDAYLLAYPGNNGKQQAIAVTMDGKYMPWGFDGSNFTIRRLGQSSLQSLQVSLAAGPQRIMAGTFDRNVAELNSNATNDFGTAIDCRMFTLVGNPDPTVRQNVREVRIDYRTDSASSISLRLSGDVGATYPVDTAVALPVARLSAQTVVGTGVTGVYPAIELRHASGHTFAIQGVTAVVESMGHG